MTVATGRAGVPAVIADDVRGGRRTAVDVAREHLDRAARLHGVDAPFAVLDPERTLAEAAALDARPDRFALPLAGVPVVVEDGFDVVGRPNRHGGARPDAVAARRDDPVVRSLRAAGAVVLAVARASVPGGRCRRCGVVTAVRLGAAPLGIGVDVDGALRAGASDAGLVAFGARVLPLPGGVDRLCYGLAATTPVAATVGDVATMTDALLAGAGLPETGGPVRWAGPDAVVGRLGEGGLRACADGPPHLPSVRYVRRRRAADLATLVRELGTDVRELAPELRGQVRRGTRTLRVGGPRDAVSARWRGRVLRWMDDRGVDVLVLPVPSARHRARHLGAWNLAGLPTLVGTVDGHGDPLQLVGRPGTERSLLQVAEDARRGECDTRRRASAHRHH